MSGRTFHVAESLKRGGISGGLFIGLFGVLAEGARDSWEAYFQLYYIDIPPVQNHFDSGIL